MQLPFTPDQFNGVFRDYNDAVWPVQLLLSALAVLALGLALRPRRWSGAAASGILAFFWVWIAAVSAAGAAVIGVGLMFRSKALPAPVKASVRVDAQAATRWVR